MTVRLIDPLNPLAAEIQQEIATTYFTACRRMAAALDALAACDAAAPGDRDDRYATRRAALLAEAAERVYYVVVQREAMRMSSGRAFFAAYGVPDDVRLRMGPRRRN
jgi:hypothetical protein